MLKNHIMVHGPRALEVARLAALLPLILMTSMGHCRVVVEFPIGEGENGI